MIKDRLDDGEVPAAAPPAGADNGEPASGPGITRPAVTMALALDDRPASPSMPPAPVEAPASPGPRASRARPPPRRRRRRDRPPAPPRAPAPCPRPGPWRGARAMMPAGEPPGRSAGRPQPGRSPRPARPGPEPGSMSLTADELAEASGLATRDVRDLERYGLLEVLGGRRHLLRRRRPGRGPHGGRVPPARHRGRHMRTYKVAVDREAGLFEQIVLPLLKQPEPGRQAPGHTNSGQADAPGRRHAPGIAGPGAAGPPAATRNGRARKRLSHVAGRPMRASKCAIGGRVAGNGRRDGTRQRGGARAPDTHAGGHPA